MFNPCIFSDIKESSRGWAMNLGDEYQNFLIFIALMIAGGEGWATNIQESSVKWSHLGQIPNFKKIDLGQLLSNK